MTRGGIIIRLIDVAMIILFGFIAISDLKVRAQIKLPSEEQDPVPESSKQPDLIHIEIGLVQNFVVRRGTTVLHETNALSELEDFLVDTLRRYQAEDREMVVLIEPHEDSKIQATVSVLDLCERHDIPKNLHYTAMHF